MDSVFQCGNAWQCLGDIEAGWKLIRHLRSPDARVRSAAEGFLVEAGPRSIKLLQMAFAHGVLEPEIAAQSLVTVMTAMWWEGCGEDANNSPFHYDC
jgi:HEAT repeat protein